MAKKKTHTPNPTTDFVESIIVRVESDVGSIREQIAKFSAAFAERDAEIEVLRDEKKTLSDRNDELRDKVDELENEVAELGKLSCLRDQLERLAEDTDRPSAPRTPEQWSRCLKEILAGKDWEVMTWR
jgi:predicted  nucleic acid-binding Zn-ribbon protein